MSVTTPLFSETAVQDVTVGADPAAARRAGCSNPFYDGLGAYLGESLTQNTTAEPAVEQAPALTFQTPEYVWA